MDQVLGHSLFIQAHADVILAVDFPRIVDKGHVLPGRELRFDSWC